MMVALPTSMADVIFNAKYTKDKHGVMTSVVPVFFACRAHTCTDTDCLDYAEIVDRVQSVKGLQF